MIKDSVKRWAVGGGIGAALMAGRDKLDVLRAAWKSLESVGTIANDQLAMMLITRLCRPGATFVDVGAHIGSVIATVEQRGAKIRIIAVEAIPEKAERLVRKFKGVTVHACAVGDREGTVPFYIHTRQSGFSSLSGTPGLHDGVEEIQVPLRRLDDLLTATDVDAVKIDVEGAELGVLLGSTRVLGRGRPIVMFESGPGDAPGLGYTKPALWEFFADTRYTLHVPNRVAHNDVGMSLDGFTESHDYPRRTTNYFAIPAERRDEIKSRARQLLGVVVS